MVAQFLRRKAVLSVKASSSSWNLQSSPELCLIQRPLPGLPCFGEQENPLGRICSFTPSAWLSAGLCSILSPSMQLQAGPHSFLPHPLQHYPPAVPLPECECRL